MYVKDGEVYLCGRHAREVASILIYPAFWKGTDIPFDRDNFWGPPAPEPEPEPVIEDDEDEEDEDDEDE